MKGEQTKTRGEQEIHKRQTSGCCLHRPRAVSCRRSATGLRLYYYMLLGWEATAALRCTNCMARSLGHLGLTRALASRSFQLYTDILRGKAVLATTSASLAPRSCNSKGRSAVGSKLGQPPLQVQNAGQQRQGSGLRSCLVRLRREPEQGERGPERERAQGVNPSHNNDRGDYGHADALAEVHWPLLHFEHLVYLGLLPRVDPL